MFSFLQQKANILNSREELKDNIQKLEDQANPQLSNFGFLFRATQKSQTNKNTVTIGYQNQAFSVVNMLSTNTCNLFLPR